MSFNNWLDAESAWALAADLTGPAAVIVKHHNPCGAAEAAPLTDAYRAALASDPVSAFGGVVGLTEVLDADTARAMAEIFTEVVVAPGYTAEALEVLAAKSNLRLVEAAPPSGRDLRASPDRRAARWSRTRTRWPRTARRCKVVTAARAHRGRVGRPALRLEGLPRG